MSLRWLTANNHSLIMSHFSGDLSHSHFARYCNNMFYGGYTDGTKIWTVFRLKRVNCNGDCVWLTLEVSISHHVWHMEDRSLWVYVCVRVCGCTFSLLPVNTELQKGHKGSSELTTLTTYTWLQIKCLHCWNLSIFAYYHLITKDTFLSNFAKSCKFIHLLP